MKKIFFSLFVVLVCSFGAKCQTPPATNTSKATLIDTSFSPLKLTSGIEVIEFSVSAIINGFEKREVSYSNRITDAQRKLIESLKIGQKVYFTDIKAKTPSGIKSLSPVIFKITE